MELVACIEASGSNKAFSKKSNQSTVAIDDHGIIPEDILQLFSIINL